MYKKLKFETLNYDVKGYYYSEVGGIDVTAVSTDKATKKAFIMKKQYLSLEDLIKDFITSRIEGVTK